ncbi:glycoside hydrolase family 16 protein [Phenylobacterium sp.]|uniref:glycoside hydrolase family 16 protein n=1 Tax=Phenylobacterium sp. TaxID=1871053 RepID=UPI00286E6A21|nr:glycoside hydrolase family 16 protein [Phenylobacterium sp.]
MLLRSASLSRARLDARILACFVAGAIMAACAPARSAPLEATPDGRRLTLAFFDDFDSFRPWSGGSGVWRTTFRDGQAEDDYDLRTLKWNKELQLYVDPGMRAHPGEHNTVSDQANGASALAGRPLGLNPFSVRGGALHITTDRTPARLQDQIGGFKYTSGLITTQPTFSQTYGYFEMRALLPAGKGIWPAFWLLPSDFDWPPEIDVMESVGDPAKVFVTSHSKAAKSTGTEVSVTPGEFHTYAVSWDRELLIWYVDGREVRRQPTPIDMHKPMYLLANTAIGGDWAGAPDTTTPFPAHFVIDYIRAYRFAP